MNFTSPILGHSAVDPQLQMQGQLPQGHHGSPGLGVPQMDMSGQANVWPPGMRGMMGAGMDLRDSDGWSTNSSIGNAPVVPTTLNVEDWFQFFGIHGSNMSGMGMDS